MKKIYKSKVALWLVATIIVVVIFSIMPLMIIDFSWIPVVVTVLIIACALYYMYSITYEIVSGTRTLTVKCGFWQKTQYNIGEINKIKRTTVTESAPAASLDRIAIYFNNQKIPLIISPENKEEFIKDLKALNPDIIYKRD